jgi:hypothetical protein
MEHAELTEINLENLQLINESEYEHIPIGNNKPTELPRHFRYYYDYAGRTLKYIISQLRINFFKTSFEKVDVFAPSDIYVLSHVYDKYGRAYTSTRRIPLTFKSDALFGPQLDNLTIFRNLVTQSSDEYRRIIDDIDPQLAFLMWTDTTLSRQWHSLFTKAFRGMYRPPDIAISTPKLRDIYMLAYFLLSHAVYNSDVACPDFYRAPKNKKRVCFAAYRKLHPNFFDDPYIHEKLMWVAGADFKEPALNTALYDLLINPFRNIQS